MIINAEGGIAMRMQVTRALVTSFVYTFLNRNPCPESPFRIYQPSGFINASLILGKPHGRIDSNLMRRVPGGPGRTKSVIPVVS